jgi:multiple sugar transport system ATP-binding protein
VARAAEILALTPLLDRYPRQLSGGQRQRVAMGRAIVRDPQVFLFDEPLSNLDAKLRVAMRTEIKELHQRLKTTTVYVTHDQIEAMTMADKIVVLRNGQVEQVGPPLELYDRPANTFVAQFIGSPAMNLIQGTANGSSFASESGQELKLSRKIDPARRVFLGIRPEHLDVIDAPAPNAIPASVLQSESTGTMTYASFAALGTTLQLAIPGRRSLAAGQQTHLAFDAGHCHFFDAESLIRL